MPITNTCQHSRPDQAGAHKEATACAAVEELEYFRPRAFSVGPASNLVRGYSYGKYSDGYTGYYWER